jgi:hypothetical protein
MTLAVEQAVAARLRAQSIDRALVQDISCVVKGDVIYMTSNELEHGVAARKPVTLRVRKNHQWRISAYASAPSSTTSGN